MFLSKLTNGTAVRELIDIHNTPNVRTYCLRPATLIPKPSLVFFVCLACAFSGCEARNLRMRQRGCWTACVTCGFVLFGAVVSSDIVIPV